MQDGFSQDPKRVDSLVHKLKESDDKREKASILKELTKTYWKTDSTKTYEYGHRAIKLAKEVGSMEIAADAMYYIGRRSRLDGYPAKSRKLFEKSLNLSREHNYYQGQGLALTGLALLEQDSANYEEAQSLYLENISIQEKNGTQKDLARGFGYMVYFHYYQSDYEQAFVYLDKQITIAKQINSPTLYITLANAGALHLQTGDIPKAIHFTLQSIELAREAYDLDNLASSLENLGLCYQAIGLLSIALEQYISAVDVRKEIDDQVGLAASYSSIAYLLNEVDSSKPADAISYFHKSLDIVQSHSLGTYEVVSVYLGLGDSYIRLGDLSKAHEFYQKALDLSKENDWPSSIAQSHKRLGKLYFSQGQNQKALIHYKNANRLQLEMNEDFHRPKTLNGLGEVHLTLGNFNKSIAYLRESIQLAQKSKRVKTIITSQELLMECYAKLGDYTRAYEASVRHKSLSDSINQEKNAQQIGYLKASFEFDQKTDSLQYENQLQELIIAGDVKKISNQRKTIFSLSFGLFCLAVFGVIIFRYSRIQAHLRKVMQKQKLTLENTNKELNQTMESLKITQNQLIQSEKMASLGVLTAGIAHEMNNPLNFTKAGVRSIEKHVALLEQQCHKFSNGQGNVVNKLLNNIKELCASAGKGTQRTAEIVNGLNYFVHCNDQKMHPVDIQKTIDTALIVLKNTLNKNITIKKEFIEKGPMIPGYAGKLNQVFLNIIINAVQAIGEKKGTIRIKVLKEVDRVVVRIKDNGTGIPLEVQNKIFDPFFTTKGVGEGTGLGLSIVYTLIEQHHGKIDVISQETQGTEFIVELPLTEHPIQYSKSTSLDVLHLFGTWDKSEFSI